MNVPAGSKVPLVITGATDKTKGRLAAHLETVSRLGRIESIDFVETPPAGSVQIVLDEATIALPLHGVIDIDAEADRLKREIDKVGAEITQIDAKLANDKFVSRAPQHVVEEQRERKADAEAVATKLVQALKRLEAAL
jgi:valyl-tRNA synthetase